MTLTSQDLTTVLKAPFQDKQWGVNLVLQGAVLTFFSFLIIGLPFLSGFIVAITRNAINGDHTLPNWQLGQYFKDGLKLFAVGIIYLLPMWIAWFIVILLFVVSILLTEQDDVFAFLTIISSIVMMALYAVTFLYSLALALVQPVYMPLLAIGAPFRACFQFKEYIWPFIKQNIGNILLGLLFSYLAGLIASVGMIFFFVGYFFTFPYALAVIGNVHGLVYRQSALQYKRA